MKYVHDFLDQLKTPESFWILITVILDVSVAIIIRYLIIKVLKKMCSKTDGDPWKIEQTQFVFLNRLISGFIYFIAFIIVLFYIPPFRSLALSLSFSTSIVAAFILFASQQTLANVISGLFIVFSKPFRVGDYVATEKANGFVEDVTLRHVVIRDNEHNRFIVPNSYFSTNSVKNFTFTENTIDVNINVSIIRDISIVDGKKIIELSYNKCFKEESIPPVLFFKVKDNWIIYKIRIHILQAQRTEIKTSSFIHKLIEESENFRFDLEGPIIQIETEFNT